MRKSPVVVALASFLVWSCGKGAIESPGGGAPTGPGGSPTTGPGGVVEPPGPLPPPPYEPLPPAVYGGKIKDLLTGMPLNDAELLTVVQGGPPAMKGLIDTWMTTPQFKARMFEFFKIAFQQTQLDITDLDDQLRLDSADVSRADQQKMLRSVEESFARTVLAMIDEGRPFTDTVTTTRFMLNVPMMVSLAYMDAAPRDDQGRTVANGYWIVNKYGGARTFKFTQVTNLDPVTGLAAPIPPEQTFDPASPNFLKFTFSQPDPARYMPCPEPVVVMGTRGLERVFGAIYGSRDACQGAPAAPSLFTDADWNTWRMVTIRQPATPAEERTLFWDLARLRNPQTSELVLGMPRVGFMSTLAFFANWPTNPSNAYRVTTNQALIVALGRSFDDRSTTVQVAETSVEAQHVQPGSPCFGCHSTLDPMRDFFKQSYSITYFQQLASGTNRRNPIPPTGTFQVAGSPPVVGNGVATFARAVAEHPFFPLAWAKKLCQLANASNCLDDDPELLRVADVFRASGFDWKTLVREVYSSPLVTFAVKTRTAEQEGVTIGIARRETFCARLSNRLDLQDACNLKGESLLARQTATQAANLAQGIPGSSYARADEQPVMPHDPNLFFMSATDKLCGLLAQQLVGNAAATGAVRWRPQDKDAAFDEFVALVMGVPGSDERAPALRGVLARHYDAALGNLTTGNNSARQVDALRSTFILACSSPSATSAGL